MKALKKIIVKYGSTITAGALAFGVFVINPFCVFFFHDPEVPEELKKLGRK